jgi:succinate dehydrogenase / fumarate reductase cytochrome b subunit
MLLPHRRQVMSDRSPYAFYARKLFELSGMLPIGAFLIDHLYSNFQVVGAGGRERFDKVVVDLQTNPAIIYAEIFAIALPLLYHAAYGLFVIRIARPNAGAYGYLRNWTYVLQRVTGAVLLLYIGYHVYNTRLYPLFHPDDPLLQRVGGKALVSSDYMHRYVESVHLGLPVFWIYVVGLGCAAFHFGNGLWNLGVHWGLLIGRQAQRRAGWAVLVVGGALFYLGLRSLLAFAQLGA